MPTIGKELDLRLPEEYDTGTVENVSESPTHLLFNTYYGHAKNALPREVVEQAQITPEQRSRRGDTNNKTYSAAKRLQHPKGEKVS
jgi:hypothetical protein